VRLLLVKLVFGKLADMNKRILNFPPGKKLLQPMLGYVEQIAQPGRSLIKLLHEDICNTYICMADVKR
jgi:hypothetical protein